MNQRETIFDSDFEKQNVPRRRDLMPKWLTIYMWVIIVFGLLMICYAGWKGATFDASDAMAGNPENGAAYRFGYRIGQFIPGILFLLMGEFVRSERRRAIRFNWGVAIFWLVFTLFFVLVSGVNALFIGVLMPLFIPYWVGLFSIQRRWEKEAVKG